MKFNIRYQGQTHEYDDETYNPRNYGTKRLNIRVNSSSVAKFGLTTNTNALEYCRFKVRVGGETAYIARTYTTSYISGETPNYNGSYSAARSVSTTMQSESQSALTSQAVTVVTSSASVSTNQVSSSYTGTTGSGSYSSPSDPGKYTNENSTGSTAVTLNTLNRKVTTYSAFYSVVNTFPSQPVVNKVTNEVRAGVTAVSNSYATVLVNTVSGTNGAGSGSYTSPSNPGKNTNQNNTGSTVTSNTSLYSTAKVYDYSGTATGSFTYDVINAHGTYDNGNRSYSYTKTAVNTGRYTTNAAANQGPATSAANPGTPTWTNANGITVVTKTQQFKSLTRVDTYYSRSQLRVDYKWTNDGRYARQLQAAGANKSMSSRYTFSQTYLQNRYSWTISKMNDYNGVANAAGHGNAATQAKQSQADQSFSASTTRRFSNSTLNGSSGQVEVTGAWATVANAGTSVQRTLLHSKTNTSNVSVSIKTTTRTDYISRVTRTQSNYEIAAKQAVQTWYSSYSADRWSYWWNSSKYYTLSTYTGTYNYTVSKTVSTWYVSTSSCKKYTNSTYNQSFSSDHEYYISTYDVHTTSCSKASSTTYYTSRSSSTSSVSETLHNMNL